MKPYFAVLYDSFLESIQSKVLWILLAAWSLILIALFPLALSQGESYAFNNAELIKPKVILDQLAAASAGKGTRAQKAIYAKLDAPFQDTLKQRYSTQSRIPIGQLIVALNALLKSEDLYDKQAWPTAEKRTELKGLIEKESKSASELEKLNRELVDLAFQGSTKSAAGQATWITYAGLKLGNALPFTEKQIKPFIETLIFPLVMRLGLGVVAMFVAIIITSPMIPDMFQTGSMHLLLSKPLSRSWLFLTKFVGGCTFVAFNIVFLLVGLYLYAGTRLGIWNIGILWCIPLFIFTFMIFYSVSALVGLIWKNPIICVVVTALFWGVCFGVGLIHFYFDLFLHIQNQTQRIYSVANAPIISTLQGRIQFWDEKSKQWKTGFGEVDGQKLLGPIAIENEKSLYFGRTMRLPFGMSSGQDLTLQLAHIPDLIDPEDKSYPSKVWEDGRLDSGPDLPADSQSIFAWKDSFGVFSENGIYRYDAESAANAEQQKSLLGAFNLGLPSKGLAFVNLTKKEQRFAKPMDLFVSPSFENTTVYSAGKIYLFKSNGAALEEAGTLQVGQTKAQAKNKEAPAGEFSFPSEKVAILANNDALCVLCPTGLEPIIVDLKTMTIQRKITEIGPVTIKQIAVDHTGQFLLLTTDGFIWQLDAQGEQARKPAIAGQGSGNAIHFNQQNALWIAHSIGAADLWDLAANKSLISIRPRYSVAESIFQYIINPFYQINPKPAAVNETIEYVLRNPNNKSLEIDRSDLEGPKTTIDPWTPIWSNLGFIVVMLGVSCWYLYRQDL